MSIATADRIANVRRSFVREILKATAIPNVISFAGGLPNPKFIPVEQIGREVQNVLASDGPAALQYCTTEGYPPLREWIAVRYREVGVDVAADQILITTGSQQGLDIIGKVLINPGDRVIVEDPTYIAALQTFGMYEAEFSPVSLDDDGANIDELKRKIGSAKVFYCMPNFQNPTGISYSSPRRDALTKILVNTTILLVEDDPYGQLRFRGEMLPPISRHRTDRSILLGSFSKTIAPGLRLGWLCAPPELMDKLIIAKQSVDLHSENLGQRVIYRIVTTGAFEPHLQRIRDAYRRQCDAMLDAISRHLPREVRTTRPDGGMFLWLTLPTEMSAMKLFEHAIEQGVAFVPGAAFHAAGGGENTMRLNFSNSDEERIEEGMRRLANAIAKMSGAKKSALHNRRSATCP
jgi:2-aminoadipate transaminase